MVVQEALAVQLPQHVVMRPKRSVEEATKAAVTRIIEEKTWWNTFIHYKHDVVYEIRIASGEGIRWKKSESELELIGFLEPFLQELN